jgi:hypothetical protein
MTYFRARKILEKAPEDIKTRLRSGKTSISKEYQKIQKEERKQALINESNNNTICSSFSSTSSFP